MGAAPPSVAVKLHEIRVLDPVDEGGSDWGEALILNCCTTPGPRPVAAVAAIVVGNFSAGLPSTAN